MAFEVKRDSPEHARWLQEIRDRFKMSYNAMSKRYDAFTRADEQFIAYLPEREADRLKRELRELGKPQYTTVEIPLSYAILMTTQAYLTTIYLARNPVFQFTGRHGETEKNRLAIEAIHQYQTMVGEMLAPLYFWILDSRKYGLGVLCAYWDKDIHRSTQIEEVPQTLLGLPMGPPKMQRVTREYVGYEGNRVFNVRPFDFMPDPRVPTWRLQDGEFCGRLVTTSWNAILRDAAKGRYFNIKELEKVRNTNNFELWMREQGSGQLIRPEDNDQTYGPGARQGGKGYITLLEMIIELSPREWGLGESRYPEKWAFTVANGDLIIGAKPFGWAHDKYPYFTLEPEADGHSFINRGTLEVIKPLQDTISWLFNAHFYNVRKAMNDMIVFDPSRIEENDLLDPLPGRLIRAKPMAYGQDVRLAVQQLQVQDVTRGHIEDMLRCWELIQRVTGVTDNVMGLVNPGGRKTATEIRSSTSFGVNRLKTAAEFDSSVGWQQLATLLLQQTQQMYTGEKSFRIAGELAQDMSNPWVQVTPESIAGFYDYVPVDGTLPVDNFALVNTWRELINQLSKIPQVAMQYDFGKIFGYVAQLAGIRDLSRFKLQAQVVPDAALAAQAQAGNAIPLTGGANGGNGGAGAYAGGNQPVAAGVERFPQPRQVSGVGPAG